MSSGVIDRVLARAGRLAPRALRLRLAARGHRLPALALGGETDPVLLSRLDMHAAAARAFAERPGLARRWPAEALRSYFFSGDAARARDLAEAVSGRSGRALALALAPIDVTAAERAGAAARGSLRAALRVEAGDIDGALALAADDEDMTAALIPGSWAADTPTRQAGWATAFVRGGMAPIAALDPARPITLHNARAEAPVVEGGETISVVMPVRNAESYVGAAVRSVLDQGWRSIEFWLIDDASTDGTARAALAAADGDARFRLLTQDRRAGPYVARNRAMALAAGRWIAFQDADEWAHPDRLRIQRAAMSKRGLVASVGRSVRIDAEGRARARGVWPLVRWAPSTLMIEREPVLARAGFLEPVMSGADSEYWWRLVALFGPRRAANLTQPLILGAWRADSLTGAADTGYGTAGVNLERLAYWEAWNFRHLRSRGDPPALRLGPGGQPSGAAR